jgi:hypothetical protein
VAPFGSAQGRLELVPFPVEVKCKVKIKVNIKVKGIGQECPIHTRYAVSGELPEAVWVRVRGQGSFGAKGAPQDDNVYSLATFRLDANPVWVFGITPRGTPPESRSLDSA